MSLTEIEFAILFILLMRHISDWNRNIKWEKCKTRLLDCKDLFIYISIDTQQDRMPQKWTQVEEEDVGEWLESTRAWRLQVLLIDWFIDWLIHVNNMCNELYTIRPLISTKKIQSGDFMLIFFLHHGSNFLQLYILVEHVH